MLTSLVAMGGGGVDCWFSRTNELLLFPMVDRFGALLYCAFECDIWR